MNRATWLIRWLLAGALSAGSVQAACAQTKSAPLGADVNGLLAAAHRLSPKLRAASLETAAASAKAGGADALDDPTITDSYQYYKNPGVFSAHTVMVTQSFPLWGKLDLRREAAFADVDGRTRPRPANDWLGWSAEHSRREEAGDCGAAFTAEGGNHVYTERPRPPVAKAHGLRR
jgi:hypothetical protein